MENGASPRRPVGLLVLVGIIYFNVAGGPWGSEPVISSAGPLIGATVLFPLVWCFPVALLFAELFTAFPCDGSFVSWVSLAFGPKLGFQIGWWSWCSGVLDNALYPCLIFDSIINLLGVSSDSISLGWQVLARATLATVFVIPTLFNITVVGRALGVVCVLMWLPFIALFVQSVPELEPSNWLSVPSEIQWSSLLSFLYWNYNGFDCAGAYAGEVSNPHKTIPVAMFLSVLLIIGTYFIPFVILTAVDKPHYSEWKDGSYILMAKLISGPVLSSGLLIAAMLGNFGLYIAEMTKDGFQLAGMADLGLLPVYFTLRDSSTGAPRRAILFGFGVVVVLGSFNFETILSINNFLSAIAVVLEMVAALSLRFTHPEVERPYAVPVTDRNLVLLMLIPISIGSVVALNELFKSNMTFWLNTGALVLGLVIQACMSSPGFQSYEKLPSPYSDKDHHQNEDVVDDDRLSIQ